MFCYLWCGRSIQYFCLKQKWVELTVFSIFIMHQHIHHGKQLSVFAVSTLIALNHIQIRAIILWAGCFQIKFVFLPIHGQTSNIIESQNLNVSGLVLQLYIIFQTVIFIQDVTYYEKNQDMQSSHRHNTTDECNSPWWFFYDTADTPMYKK